MAARAVEDGTQDSLLNGAMAGNFFSWGTL